MAHKPIVPMVKLSKELKASLRLGTMKDVVNGQKYYWTPEMSGLGEIAENVVDFKYHKTSKDVRLYRSFFEWLIKDGRMHVIKTKKKENERKEDISKGKSLFD